MNTVLKIAQLRETAQGEIARITRKLREAMTLKKEYGTAERLTAEAERIRKSIQRDRKWQLEDEPRSDDILVCNEYWFWVSKVAL